MSFLDKLKTRVVELRVASEDLMRGDFAAVETQQSRMDTCLGCEYLYKPTSTCKKCGCFTVAKTKLKHSKCPIGKW